MKQFQNVLRIVNRQAVEHYYETDELSPNSLTKMKCEIDRWEKLTDNPPIAEITNATVAEFRVALIEAEYQPLTIKSGWGTICSILRRFGPTTDGNPWALAVC